VNTSSRRGTLGFTVIGALKVASSILLAVVGFGIFRLLGRDLGETLEGFISRLHLDPESKYIHTAISWASGIDRKHLKAIGFGTFFYAALYLVEGVGLLLQRRWAGYLTVVATSSLIPFEVYEIVKWITAAKVAVLVLNVGIVVYLIWKLRQEHQTQADLADERATSPTRP
jgi:uncharacterized membrane protein (DUF2068 family)